MSPILFFLSISQIFAQSGDYGIIEDHFELNSLTFEKTFNSTRAEIFRIKREVRMITNMIIDIETHLKEMDDKNDQKEMELVKKIKILKWEAVLILGLLAVTTLSVITTNFVMLKRKITISYPISEQDTEKFIVKTRK